MEEELKHLIKTLLELDELHQEYQDNDTHFVIDSTKEGNTLTIKVKLLENKDKKEFEEWLKKVDDNLFSEVLEELQENDRLFNLDELYNSNDYKKVIDSVKTKTKEIAKRKIKEFQKLLS